MHDNYNSWVITFNVFSHDWLSPSLLNDILNKILHFTTIHFTNINSKQNQSFHFTILVKGPLQWISRQTDPPKGQPSTSTFRRLAISRSRSYRYDTITIRDSLTWTEKLMWDQGIISQNKLIKGTNRPIVPCLPRTCKTPFLADRTNGRAIATLLRLSSSSAVVCLWRYVLWLNGAS